MTSNPSYSDVVKQLFDSFVPTVEMIFARKVSRKHRQEIETKLSELLPASLEFADNITRLKNTAPEEDQFAGYSSDFIRALLPELSSNQDPFQALSQSLLSTPNKPLIEYILTSPYQDYLDAVRNLAIDLVGSHFNDLQSYLNRLDQETPDLKAWAQSIARKMSPIIRFLTPGRKRFTTKTAEKCIEYYLKMSAIYEGLIVIFVGLVRLHQNEEPDYEGTSIDSLGNNLKKVPASYILFIRDFDLFIRNSLTHNFYVLNHAIKSITLYQKRRQSTPGEISYNELFQKTRTLSCLVLALSQWRTFIIAETLKNLVRLV